MYCQLRSFLFLITDLGKRFKYSHQHKQEIKGLTLQIVIKISGFITAKQNNVLLFFTFHRSLGHQEDKKLSTDEMEDLVGEESQYKYIFIYLLLNADY